MYIKYKVNEGRIDHFSNGGGWPYLNISHTS